MSGFEQSTEEMDRIIDGLRIKAAKNPSKALPFECLAAFVEQLKEWGLEGKTEFNNKKLSDSPWVTEWHNKKVLKTRGKDSYLVGINNAINWGILNRIGDGYRINLK